MTSGILPLDFIKRRFTGLSLERPLLQREWRRSEGKGLSLPPPTSHARSCIKNPHVPTHVGSCMHFFSVCVCRRLACSSWSPRGLLAVRRGLSRASPRRSKMKGMCSSDEELRERWGVGPDIPYRLHHAASGLASIFFKLLPIFPGEMIWFIKRRRPISKRHAAGRSPPPPPRLVDLMLPLRHVIFC